MMPLSCATWCCSTLETSSRSSGPPLNGKIMLSLCRPIAPLRESINRTLLDIIRQLPSSERKAIRVSRRLLRLPISWYCAGSTLPNSVSCWRILALQSALSCQTLALHVLDQAGGSVGRRPSRLATQSIELPACTAVLLMQSVGGEPPTDAAG
jgi:hypothetical protein